MAIDIGALETAIGAALNRDVQRRGKSQSRFAPKLRIDNTYTERAASGTLKYHDIFFTLPVEKRDDLDVLTDRVTDILIGLAASHPIIRDTISVTISNELVAEFELLDFQR